MARASYWLIPLWALPSVMAQSGVTVPPPIQLWPGPVSQCIEAKIGHQAKEDLQNNVRPPTAAEAQVLNDCNAPSIFYDKFDLASITPVDAPATVSLGPVSITYSNPVTMGVLENVVHMTFVARNTGNTTVTLRSIQTATMTALPPTILQWLPVFEMPHTSFDPGTTSRQSDVVLAPGATTTFEWSATNDTQLGSGVSTTTDGIRHPFRYQGTLYYRFDLVESGQTISFPVQVVQYDGSSVNTLASIDTSVKQPAAIVGRLTARDGRPIANADVNIWIFSRSNFVNLKTDGNGAYATQVPAIQDLTALMSRNLEPYGKIGYFVWANAPGYSLGFRDGLSPAPGETVTADLVLDPAGAPVSYHMIGEKRTQGPFGYWWTMFTPTLDAVEAVQADHPPQPVAAGHVIKLDLNGNELWRVPTAQECWGFDISPNGEWTAAVCDDNIVYLMDQQGALRRIPAPAYQLRFSPDSKTLIAGSTVTHGVALLEVPSGNVLWTYDGTTEVLRNARWSADGSRITLGFSAGQVAQVTSAGKKIWQAGIGEYPLYLAVDAQNNVYAAGKSRILFSWDATGKLRWRLRMMNTLNNGLTFGARDGSYIVTHSITGELAAFDSQGKSLWKRDIPVGSPGVVPGMGHQGLDVTPDGKWTVIGTFEGTVALLDQTGTVRWSYTTPDPPTTRPPTSYCLSKTCAGAQSVNISPDGKYIAAGFENSVIRIFQRDDPPANAPAISSINTAGGGPEIAQNTWIEIKGANLAPAALGAAGFLWDTAPEFAGGRMPTALQGVSVTVNGKPAYVYFVSPSQVNVLTPLDGTQGTVQVVVTAGGIASAPFAATMRAAAPAFFLLGATKYVAAQHANFSLAGPAALSVPGYLFTPATPGETVTLYGTGFGLPATALVDGASSQSGALPVLPTVQIGGTPASVVFAGVIGPGLYQLNVVVPPSASDGDLPITAGYGGATATGALLTVKR